MDGEFVALHKLGFPLPAQEAGANVSATLTELQQFSPVVAQAQKRIVNLLN